MKIKIFFTFLIFLFVAIPVTFVFANGGGGILPTGLVPCGGPAEPLCDFDQLLILVNRIINFLLYALAVPVATVMFAYAGWLFLSAGGDSGQVSKAKSVMWSVVVGLVIALAAWLIVNTITSALLSDEFKRPGFWFL